MRLSYLISDNAVFAMDVPILLPGTGKGKMTVIFDDIEYNFEFNEENWVAELPPHKAGGPFRMTVIFDDIIVHRQSFSNIHVGIVVLLAGQSNAELKMCETNTPDYFCRSNDNVRIFTFDRPERGKEIFKEEDGWQCARENQVKNLSAIAYLTAMLLSKNTGLVCGVICCYQGASMIYSWLPKEAAERLMPPENQLHYDYNAYPDWNSPGILYDLMLKKTQGFGLSCVIWYQGESDTTPGEAKCYRAAANLLIDEIRKGCGNKLLPVLIVQIADFDSRNDEGWKLLQMAQLELENRNENIFVVSAGDICESNMIHPVSKFPLAVRLADKIMALIFRG